MEEKNIKIYLKKINKDWKKTKKNIIKQKISLKTFVFSFFMLCEMEEKL